MTVLLDVTEELEGKCGFDAFLLEDVEDGVDDLGLGFYWFFWGDIKGYVLIDPYSTFAVFVY